MNTQSYYTRNSCRICSGKNLVSVVNVPQTPVGDNYKTTMRSAKEEEFFPLELCWCSDCLLLQLRDVVNPDLIYRNYIYSTSDSLGLVDHFKQYARDVISRLSMPAQSNCLDIGCNDGTLLSALKQQGMSVVGVEPSYRLAEKNNEQGINTLCDYFSSQLAENIIIEFGKQDLIFANNVTANIDNITDFFQGIKCALSPKGIFILETGYGLNLLKDYILDNVYHEHYSYYTVSSLNYLCNKVGLFVDDIEYVDTKGGSIRVYIRHYTKSDVISPKVLQYLEIEKNLLNEQLCRQFSEHCVNQKNILLSELDQFSKSSRRVFGFGASVGVTTLLYYFQCGDRLSGLVDDNVSRHGLYSPGYGLAVNSVDTLAEESGAVILFPWRYEQAILKKHENESLSNLCSFVPLPVVKKVIGETQELLLWL